MPALRLFIDDLEVRDVGRVSRAPFRPALRVKQLRGERGVWETNGVEDEQTVDAIEGGQDPLACDLHLCDSLMWATDRYKDEQSLGYKRSGLGPPEPLNEPPIPNN